MRRPLAYAAVVLITGILYGIGQGIIFLALGLILVALGPFIHFYSHHKPTKGLAPKWLFFIFLFTLLISIIHSSKWVRMDQTILSQVADGETITIHGQVQSVQETENSTKIILSQVTTDLLTGTLHVDQLLVYPESSTQGSWQIGSYVQAKGQVAFFSKARNPGNFDQESFYHSRGILFSLRRTVLIQETKPRGFSIHRSLFALRTKLNQVYHSNLPGEEAGLISAMSLGDKNDLSEEAKLLFQMAGIIHLLSVSGTHISALSSNSYRFLKGRGVGLFQSAFLSGLLALLYGDLCGNSVSTIRAVGMFLLLLFGDVRGRTYDTLSGLALLAILLLFQNPLSILDPSFQFSFGAVLVVVLIQRPVQKKYISFCRDRYDRIYRRKADSHFALSLKEHVVNSIIGAVLIQFGTLPLVAFFFYEVPSYVFLLNLLVLPLFPALLITALSGALVNLWLPLPILFGPIHFILYFYEFMADLSLKLPGGQVIVGKPWKIVILFFYVFLLAIIHLPKWRIRERYRWLLLPCLIFLIIHPKWSGSYIDALDVGQGEGIFIHTRQGENLMVDGGSSDVSKVGTYRILPYLKSTGIPSLDYWIVTHGDLDHLSGMEEVIQSGYQVKHMVLAKGMKEDEKKTELLQLAKTYDIQVLYTEPGDVLHLEGNRSLAFPKKNPTELVFLFPGREMTSVEDGNQACQSFLLRDGDFRGVFTGDLDQEGEERILSSGFLPRTGVDFLSAGHHGSRTSTCDKWLDELHPKMVEISAGMNNSYGHPSKETIQRLEDRRIPYYVTMDTGMQRYTYRKGRAQVEVFCYTK